MLPYQGCLFKPDKLRKSGNGYRQNWKCVTEHCSGSLGSNRATADSTEITDIVVNHEHTILGLSGFCKSFDKFDILTCKAIQLIREMCLVDGEKYASAHQAVDNLLTHYDTKIATYFHVGTLAHTISLDRRKVVPPIPKARSIDPVVVPQQYSVTNNGKPFLLLNNTFNHQQTPDKIGRILVFGTHDFMFNLLHKEKVYVDGTFSAVPPPFYQLFTIHGFDGNVLVPFLYVFLSHKSQAIYDRFFRWLKWVATLNNVQIQWKTIVNDFETGLLASIKASLPGVTVMGCVFHFCQPIVKKLKSMGLSTEYSHNSVVRLYFLRIMILPYMPLDKVQQVYDEIPVPNIDALITGKLAVFTTYFVGFWMTPTMMPIWNVFGVVDGHRTNNNLEAWNRTFGKKCEKKDKILWPVVSLLKDEQASWESKQMKLSAGGDVNRQQSLDIRKKNRIIEKLHRMLQNGMPIAAYVKGIFIAAHY